MEIPVFHGCLTGAFHEARAVDAAVDPSRDPGCPQPYRIIHLSFSDLF